MVGKSWTWTVTLSRVCTKTWPEEVIGWLWGEGLRSLRSKVTLRAKGWDLVTPQGRGQWLPGVQHPRLRGWQRHEMSTNFLNLHLQVQPWFLPVYATRVRNHGNNLGVIAFPHHSPTLWLLTTQWDPPGTQSSTISVSRSISDFLVTIFGH